MSSCARFLGGLLIAGLAGLCSCDDGGTSGAASGGAPAQPWPPVLGQSFPDLELQDSRGERVRLSSLRGKLLLIEPIGMT